MEAPDSPPIPKHGPSQLMWGSIRTRLIALVAVVSTPFVLVVAGTSVADYRESVRSARTDALAVACPVPG